MANRRNVLVDKTLDHQVQIINHENRILVTCNCRRQGEYFGSGGTLELVRKHFNNPTNHRGTFTKEDEFHG
jgi:hypothetical protein